MSTIPQIVQEMAQIKTRYYRRQILIQDREILVTYRWTSAQAEQDYNRLKAELHELVSSDARRKIDKSLPDAGQDQSQDGCHNS